MKIDRILTSDIKIRDSYMGIEVERRDAVITNEKGEVFFSQKNVEVPKDWSQTALNIVAQKYFRGKLGSLERENSVISLVERVAKTITNWGIEQEYFDNDDAANFLDELRYILIKQYAAFNSPVWFNVGVEDNPQCSACLPGYATVMTDFGMMTMRDIINNKLEDGYGIKIGLITKEGVASLEAKKNNGFREVIEIELVNGSRLYATTDHRFFSAHHHKGNGKWKRVDELNIGDYLWRQRTVIEQGDQICESEAALAGWLVCNGFIGKYECNSYIVEFETINEYERSWIREHLDVVFPNVKFNEIPEETEDPNIDFIRFRSYGRIFRDFIEKYELMYRKKEARVPKRIKGANIRARISYLKSVFQCNGYITKERHSVGLSRMPRDFIDGVQLLLQSVGIFSRYGEKKDKREDRFDSWCVDISYESEREIFRERIGFLAKDKNEALFGTFSRKGKQKHDLHRVKIKSIKMLDEPEEVFDIQSSNEEFLYEGYVTHNCFINEVEDDMDSILDLVKTEGMLFKHGSGTGTNFSTLRSTKEHVRGGGYASGPVSFMRGYDSWAGVIRSGGKCLIPWQRIYTNNGPVRVEELAKLDEFICLSFDPPRNRYVAKKAQAWKSSPKEMIRITTDKGFFEVSYDHPIRMADGNTVNAGNLREGMSLFSCVISENSGYLRVNLRDGLKGKNHLHRLVAEDILQCKNGDIVHHIDGDRMNNDISNLKIMPQSEHASIHGKELFEKGSHVFSKRKFSRSEKLNGMHADSVFWKNSEKVEEYRKKQRDGMKKRNPSELQKLSVRKRMKNLAYRIINNGGCIDTFDLYCENRKKIIGNFSSAKKILESIENNFGGYESFLKEVKEDNHRVLRVESIGIHDSYDVEVFCETNDDKTENSGHNFVIWSDGRKSGSGIAVFNTRRAAKIAILNVNHPDIMDFINCKVKEEKKAWALIDAGYDGSINGDAYNTVCYQNANNSVRVTDEFMGAYENDDFYDLIAVTDGKAIDRVKARDVFTAIAEAAHVCGDPGIQFDTTINSWNTVPSEGRINSSNPCISRGTRLLTSSGWKKVEDLDGKSVGIFDGFGYVKGEVWKTGVKDIVKIKTNRGHEIRLTGDHRILTEIGFVPAVESRGLIIPCVLQGNAGSDLANKIPKCITGKTGKYYSYASKILMESLGFLQGDGGYNKSSRVVSLYFTKGKDTEFIENTVLPIFSDINKTDPSYNLNKRCYVFSSSYFFHWLEEIGMDMSALPDRDLPNFLFGLTHNAQCSFLRGLFGANGNVCCDSNEAIRLVSTCKEMLNNVQLLLQSMDISSSVRCHNKEVNILWPNGEYVSKESYHLEITDMIDRIKFAKFIGFPQRCQQEKLRLICNANSVVDSYSGSRRNFLKIISVESCGKDDVYDFSCPITNIGLANGLCVHNCGEYMFLDNSACNLASINLKKFNENGEFNFDLFSHVVRIMIIAQDILVDKSGYPTKKIKENSHKYRTLGLGYANLGALLMSKGIPYDSKKGRGFAAAVTSLMTAEAYCTSIEMAKERGSFEGFDCKHMDENIIGRHAHESTKISEYYISNDFYKRIFERWAQAKTWLQDGYGCRNAQTTLLAPTGTIGFMMDCDTTGIEPELALVKYKKMVGGGTVKIVNQSVVGSLESLKYNSVQIEEIVDYIEKKGTIDGSPYIKEDHLAVFDCSLRSSTNGRMIDYMGHIKMMAAVQPFLSGAISKTVNMPSDSTVEDIKNAYIQAWRLGLKSITVYRDGCKRTQPLNTSMDEKKESNKHIIKPPTVNRAKMPNTRSSVTHRFNIGGHKGYITAGMYESGFIGEIFINVAKEGSTIRGLMDSFATAISIGLQHGVPLKVWVDKFSFTIFEPSGITDNPEIRMAKSIMDYIFRWLDRNFPGGKHYLMLDDDNEKNIASDAYIIDIDAPTCRECGALMSRSGSCYKCDNCGGTSGCS
jgi:ribonucleoside-diphosphate reductase alpha chain